MSVATKTAAATIFTAEEVKRFVTVSKALVPTPTSPVALAQKRPMTKREKALKHLMDVADAYRKQKIKQAGEALEARREVFAAVQQIDNFFKHALPGQRLAIYPTAKPFADLKAALQAVQSQLTTRLVFAAIPRDIEGETTAKAVAFTLSGLAEQNLFAQVMLQSPDGDYNSLVNRFSGRGRLLATAPGHEQINVVLARAYFPGEDPNQVLAVSIQGGLLGALAKRAAIDGVPAEPIAGDCNEAKGALQVGKLTREFQTHQLDALDDLALTCARNFPGVGSVVAWGNRSLHDPGRSLYDRKNSHKISRSVFISCVRLKLAIAAKFANLAEKYMLFAGRKDRGSVQAAGVEMGSYLSGLQEEGWLEEQGVIADPNSLLFQIKVLVRPTPPVHAVQLIYVQTAAEFIQKSA